MGCNDTFLFFLIIDCTFADNIAGIFAFLASFETFRLRTDALDQLINDSDQNSCYCHI
ncbi:unnamed protein product [Haemonchus placei]|uniref:Uncharacterized protein n=1 Tax=Haemonchus placei TaxID=6290 RepID=A0A3P7XVP8_HAEPC|nr:unnamed protein product [Haemonchus placei]